MNESTLYTCLRKVQALELDVELLLDTMQGKSGSWKFKTVSMCKLLMDNKVPGTEKFTFKAIYEGT